MLLVNTCNKQQKERAINIYFCLRLSQNERNQRSCWHSKGISALSCTLYTFVLPYASWRTKLNFQVQRGLGNVAKWYYHKNLLVVYKATITKKVGSIQTKKIECIQSKHQLRSIQYKRLFLNECIQSKHTEQAYNRCFCLIGFFGNFIIIFLQKEKSGILLWKNLNRNVYFS